MRPERGSRPQGRRQEDVGKVYRSGLESCHALCRRIPWIGRRGLTRDQLSRSFIENLLYGDVPGSDGHGPTGIRLFRSSIDSDLFVSTRTAFAGSV